MAGLTELNLQIQSYLEANPYMMTLVLVIFIWKLIWYGLALYKSGDLKQKSWFTVLFVAAFVLNDLGILPIIYLILYRDKKKTTSKKEKFSKKSKRR